MTMWPVDKRVGNVKNDDASLIEADFPASEALAERSSIAFERLQSCCARWTS